MKAWSFRRWGENGWLTLDILAITVGLAGGLVAVIFRVLVERIHWIFFGPLLSALPGGEQKIVLLPILGGLLAGFLVLRTAPEIKGDGISALMEALHKGGGRIGRRTGLILLLAAPITIGSGGSAGRDSPIAHIAASFGSLVAQRFSLTAKDVQILTVCGLVAGLAGTFNAPLGSAIFGMEVIMRRFRMVDSVPILLSAVVGAAVASTFLGQSPAFDTSHIGLTLAELWLCFFLGLAFGLLSTLWVCLLYKTENLFDRLRLRGELKAGLGGVVVGVSGLFLIDYGIMGVGYEGIDRILDLVSGMAEVNPAQLILLLMILAAVKCLATASTLGSGASGGSIGPTLYAGTMMGAALGLIFGDLFPGVEGHAATYALLGAGALFAGAAGAPLTCIVMIPEMATDYSLLLPMMISCAASYGLAQILLEGSTMYTLKLKNRGVELDTNEALLRDVSVREAMRLDVMTANPKMTVKDVRDMITEHNIRGFPVVEEGQLVGVITFDDVRKVPEEEQGQIEVDTVAIKNVIIAYPDESMKQVMDRLCENNVGRLPVVERDDPRKLVGIVTKSDAIRAYEIAVKEWMT